MPDLARPLFLTMLALALLAGCEKFPEVDRAESTAPAAPPPRLLPIDEILAETAAPRAEAKGAALDSKGAALRERAARLRRRPAPG